MILRKIQTFTPTAILLIVSIAVSGCATSARSIDSGEELSKAGMTSQEALVFGKFALQRNGENVKLSNTLFGNPATLHLVSNETDERIIGTLGQDGEFAWALTPGDYTVASVSFMNRGEKFKPDADYRFTVAAGGEPVYIGTITLESTFESGYFGLNGTVDSYRIDNHCEADCADRLTRLGLSSSELTVALMTPQDSLTDAR
ncbi:MAG: hypothetical protein AAFX10_11380 [Pseudomonadota bacterium]